MITRTKKKIALFVHIINFHWMYTSTNVSITNWKTFFRVVTNLINRYYQQCIVSIDSKVSDGNLLEILVSAFLLENCKQKLCMNLDNELFSSNRHCKKKRFMKSWILQFCIWLWPLLEFTTQFKSRLIFLWQTGKYDKAKDSISKKLLKCVFTLT